MSKIFNMFFTKDIYLGYVSVINSSDFRNSYIEDTVIALKKVKYKDTYKYEPILTDYSYYSINKVYKLTEKVDFKGVFIKPEELKVIVDNERNKYKLNKKGNANGFDFLNNQKINIINNELDINKKLDRKIN